MARGKGGAARQRERTEAGVADAPAALAPSANAKKPPHSREVRGLTSWSLPSHQSGQQQVEGHQKLWRTPTAKELKSLPAPATP